MANRKDKAKAENKTPAAKAPAGPKHSSKPGGLSRRDRFIIPGNEPRRTPRNRGNPMMVLDANFKRHIIFTR